MNQYRCETCNHFVGKMANYFGVDQPFCKNPKMIEYFKSLPKDPGCTPDHQSCWIPSHIIREGDLNFAPLSKYDVERIGVLGCASHSDFQSERETVLDELKRDLKTRFVSSDSQWGRGRNSGLLECCNIIDEYLRQAGEP